MSRPVRRPEHAAYLGEPPQKVAARFGLPEVIPLGLSLQVQGRVSVGPHAEVHTVLSDAALAVEG
eukprot:11345869-Alexandrium_andersonii.AAC.1